MILPTRSTSKAGCLQRLVMSAKVSGLYYVIDDTGRVRMII